MSRDSTWFVTILTMGEGGATSVLPSPRTERNSHAKPQSRKAGKGQRGKGANQEGSVLCFYLGRPFTRADTFFNQSFSESKIKATEFGRNEWGVRVITTDYHRRRINSFLLLCPFSPLPLCSFPALRLCGFACEFLSLVGSNQIWPHL